MTVYDTPKTSYSDTTPQERVISDVIYMIDPLDTPLLAAIGGLDGARSKFNLRLNGTKIEILEDEMPPIETTANHGGVIATDATSITVADASLFKDGDVIKIDDELMVVSAVNTTSNTISLYSRSYGGTNATHTTLAVISIVGQARLEGDDADFSAMTDITAPYNYTSIFQDALKVTGTAEKISQFGIANEFDYQSKKKLPHLFRLIDRAIFHGIRAAGSASTPRSFGGLGVFITDNTAAAGGAIAKVKIDDLMESIFNDGGNPDVLCLNPSVARDLKDILDTSSFVRVDQSVNSLGTAPIQAVVTQYGTLRLLMDRFCPVGTAYALDTRKVGMYTLRPFAWKELALVGDSRKGEVVGEFSLMVANDKAHGKITGITS